jgi:hypothetical protein
MAGVLVWRPAAAFRSVAALAKALPTWALRKTSVPLAWLPSARRADAPSRSARSSSHVGCGGTWPGDDGLPASWPATKELAGW